MGRVPRWVVGMVDRFEFLGLTFGIVLNDDLEGAQHSHAAPRALVQHLAHREVEHRDVHQAVGLGDPDAPDEVAYRFGRNATAAQYRPRSACGDHPSLLT